MTAPYDKLAGVLASAGLVTEGLLAPRRLGRGTVVLAAADTVSSAVTTTMWVVGSVHNDTADRWALTLVAVTAGFADLNVLVLFVADNTH